MSVVFEHFETLGRYFRVFGVCVWLYVDVLSVPMRFSVIFFIYEMVYKTHDCFFSPKIEVLGYLKFPKTCCRYVS